MSEIQFALCGSVSGNETLNPYTVTAGEERRELLLSINAQPEEAGRLGASLGMTEHEAQQHLDALVRAGLARMDGGVYRPTFALFSEADQRVLEPFLERLTTHMADAVEQAMPEVERAHEALGVAEQGFAFSDVAYMLVGGYGLDFGGLEHLSAAGYLTVSRPMPGGRYVFGGFEGRAFDIRAFWQWGHTAGFGRFLFVGHGQVPPKGSRRAFPEMAYRWATERAEEDVKTAMVEIGELLVALAGGLRSTSQLARRTGMTPEQAEEHLCVLADLGYVVGHAEAYRTLCPVLDTPALEVVRSLAGHLQREILQRAVAPLWASFEEAYATTCPHHNGVDIREAFNLLYHATFERALAELMDREALPGPALRPDGARYAIWIEAHAADGR